MNMLLLRVKQQEVNRDDGEKRTEQNNGKRRKVRLLDRRRKTDSQWARERNVKEKEENKRKTKESEH